MGVLKTFPSATKYLKTIVSFGKVTPEQKEEVEKFGLAIYAWDEFLLLLAQEGDDKQYDLPVKKKSDICTIMYTSGTTGDPKGVLISNNSIGTLIAGVRCLLGSVHELDVKLLTEDIGELKPTIFCAVPRVLDRIYAEFATEDLIWGSLKKYYVQLRRLIVYGLIISTDWVCKGFHDPRKWLLSAQDGTQASNVNVQEADPKEVTYAERSDLLILKTIKQSVELRNSVCHSATIYANAIMHAGTTVDTFLRENLHSKAVNFVRNQLRQHRDVQALGRDRRLQDNVSIIIVDLGKLHNMKKGSKHVDAAPLCDKIVFNKVKHGLGGNVQLILSGAAPLATHVEAFLRVVACCHVLQGYGLTESCAGTFVSLPNELGMLGTLGPPVPNVDVCLESIPEMGYDALSSTPRGEICIRGDTLFLGYHKREDLTKEVLIDGWLHTGDVGEWQPNGSMKIMDRKKNIFKLSQGEYVAVENLENVYGSVTGIDSRYGWVYWNSFESFLVAVVNPNKQVLERWAEENGVPGDFNSLCENPKAKQNVLVELTRIGKEKKLKGFEFIKAVHLDPEPFDMERDLLTPTFKKKRPQLLKYYQSTKCWIIPYSWETLVVSLSNSAPEGKLTMGMVTDALFNEEARKKEMDGEQSHALVTESRGRDRESGRGRGRSKSRGRSQSRQDNTRRCFYCDQEDHVIRDCPEKKADRQAKEKAKGHGGPSTTAVAVHSSDDEEVMLTVSSELKTPGWILDSGCTFHICADRKLFSTYRRVSGSIIRMANNTVNRVVGIGTVRFLTKDGRKVILSEVRHVPGVRRNLISLSMLDLKGNCFSSSGGVLHVHRGDREMLQGKLCNKLYRLEGKQNIVDNMYKGAK
ncbi:unnamed protein product [Camellia sinensis]